MASGDSLASFPPYWRSDNVTNHDTSEGAIVLGITSTALDRNGSRTERATASIVEVFPSDEKIIED